MLELVVGATAVLLALVGLAIIAGPALPRAWRGALALARSRRPRAGLPAAVSTTAPRGGAPDLHPTTMKALTAAARAYSLLRANGEDRVAGELRTAARRVRADEAQGLLALSASAFLVLAAEPLYLLVDTAIVGHLGTSKFAGFAVAGAVRPSSSSTPCSRAASAARVTIPSTSAT